MKRKLIIRISIVTVVMALGAIAIAQSLRTGTGDTAGEPKKPAAAEKSQKTPVPIPAPTESVAAEPSKNTSNASADPYASAPADPYASNTTSSARTQSSTAPPPVRAGSSAGTHESFAEEPSTEPTSTTAAAASSGTTSTLTLGRPKPATSEPPAYGRVAQASYGVVASDAEAEASASETEEDLEDSEGEASTDASADDESESEYAASSDVSDATGYAPTAAQPSYDSAADSAPGGAYGAVGVSSAPAYSATGGYGQSTTPASEKSAAAETSTATAAAAGTSTATAAAADAAETSTAAADAAETSIEATASTNSTSSPAATYPTPADAQMLARGSEGGTVTIPNSARTGGYPSGAAVSSPGGFQAASGSALPVAPEGAEPGLLAELAAATSARPGPADIPATLTPSLTIEKLAPEEVQVNRPAVFETRVRNVGKVPAHQVLVVDRVPEGAELIETTPTAQQVGDLLFWNLGSLAPGEEQILTMRIMPLAEGEIGSVASVVFQAQAAAHSLSTQPRLEVTHVSAAPEVLVGQDVTFRITIKNTGSGDATNVVIQEDVPEGLSHETGRELEYVVGTLKPDETRQLELTLQAAKAGIVQNLLVARADGDIAVQHESSLRVIAPELNVAIQGPKNRFLDRQAVFQVMLTNPGSAPAKNIDLRAYLPKGFTFVGTNNHGQYDAQQHSVVWNLEELPAGQTGTVELILLPIEMGEWKVRVQTKADLGLSAAHEHVVLVDGIPELQFTVLDLADPVEVGNEALYEVRVTNSGSKADTNVQLIAELPAGMQPLEGSGSAQGRVEQQAVVFQPIASLAPNEEARFRIRARGVADGDHRIRIALQSSALTTPVTKEESTRVYSDK